MLISNESEVFKTIHIKLKYDDGIEKEGDIKHGTELYLSFRRNMHIEVEYGVVTDIIEHTHYRVPFNNTVENTIHNTCIVFDMSEPYNSNIATIPLSDIIDFEYVPVVDNTKGINPCHKIPLKIYDSLHKE